MIRVDILELDRMALMLANDVNNADNTLSGLKSIRAEMLDNLDFMSRLQANECVESLGEVIRQMNECVERLSDLSRVLRDAVSEYEDSEKRKINALSRMSEYMESLRDNLYGAITCETIPIENERDEIKRRRIEQLIADTDKARELEVANIVAMSRVIEREYPIEEVRGMKDK